jgi:hypothetical protein
LKHFVFDRPEKIIRVHKQDLRQRPASVFSYFEKSSKKAKSSIATLSVR